MHYVSLITNTDLVTCGMQFEIIKINQIRMDIGDRFRIIIPFSPLAEKKRMIEKWKKYDNVV